MLNEFSRTELLLGGGAMERLRNSHVMVFGVGGVGSHCIEALARSGIGHLTLVDNDKVSLTNINRQSIAYHSTVGRYKTLVMKDRIFDINPDARVETREEFVLADRVEEILLEKPDFIVDAIDTITAKLALAVTAKREGIPVISCMGTGNKLDPSAFQIADLFETSVCPVCRVMRRELKKRGVETLTVLYSQEEPIKPLNAGETKGAAGRPAPGSIAFVPPVAGLMIAGHVIRTLAGC